MCIIPSIFRITILGLINNISINDKYNYVNIFQMICDTNFLVTNCVENWSGLAMILEYIEKALYPINLR